MRVGHCDEHVDQLDVHSDIRFRLRLLMFVGVRMDRILWGGSLSPEAARGSQQAHCEQTRGEFSHRVLKLYLYEFAPLTRRLTSATADSCSCEGCCDRAGYLDAGPAAGLPGPREFPARSAGEFARESAACARAISSGNGSPSAQIAPSTKCSFFQMGTVRFRVSMIQRQASNAAAR